MDQPICRLKAALDAGYYRTESAEGHQVQFPWQNKTCKDGPFWLNGICEVFAEYRYAGNGTVGTSVWGTGLQGKTNHGYGCEARGGKAALRLVPSASRGHPTAGSHQQGELIVDPKGNLFLCVAAGTPGQWKRVVMK